MLGFFLLLNLGFFLSLSRPEKILENSQRENERILKFLAFFFFFFFMKKCCQNKQAASSQNEKTRTFVLVVNSSVLLVSSVENPINFHHHTTAHTHRQTQWLTILYTHRIQIEKTNSCRHVLYIKEYSSVLVCVCLCQRLHGWLLVADGEPCMPDGKSESFIYKLALYYFNALQLT